MPADGHCAGVASIAVVVVVGPLSILASVCGDPSIVGATVVEDDGGSDSGAAVNISGFRGESSAGGAEDDSDSNSSPD